MSIRALPVKNARFIAIVFFIALNCAPHKKDAFSHKETFTSDILVVTQVAPNAFVHTTFLQTNDFGYVPCNGLIVRNGNEAFVFDTPTTDAGSEALLKWIADSLQCEVKGVIPTHFHDDCLGGLAAFHAKGIPSYASEKTLPLAQSDSVAALPQQTFRENIRIPVGKTFVSAAYFGEGHTRDNVVGYFPDEHVLFGGCMVKEIDASKGYLGDANVGEWSATVEKVKAAYPEAKVVVPGHGASGTAALLDYTIGLFKR
jgi:metallo-beta-lactamase class B